MKPEARVDARESSTAPSAQRNGISEFIKLSKLTQSTTDADIAALKARATQSLAQMRKRHESEIAALCAQFHREFHHLQQSRYQDASSAEKVAVRGTQFQSPQQPPTSTRQIKAKHHITPTAQTPVAHIIPPSPKKRKRDSAILSLDIRDPKITQEQIDFAISQRDKFLEEAGRACSIRAGYAQPAFNTGTPTRPPSRPASSAPYSAPPCIPSRHPARLSHSAPHSRPNSIPQSTIPLPSISSVFPGYFDRSR